MDNALFSFCTNSNIRSCLHVRHQTQPCTHISNVPAIRLFPSTRLRLLAPDRVEACDLMMPRGVAFESQPQAHTVRAHDYMESSTNSSQCNNVLWTGRHIFY